MSRSVDRDTFRAPRWRRAASAWNLVVLSSLLVAFACWLDFAPVAANPATANTSRQANAQDHCADQSKRLQTTRDPEKSDGNKNVASANQRITDRQRMAKAHPDLAAELLAESTTIVRDEYGVAHVNGPTLEATAFALAFAQAEDFFWQIEDSYILGLGRYAEVHGPVGINSDLLNRAFEVTRRSREDFDGLDLEVQRICIAYVNGLNYYLQTHRDVRPRLISHFEPWHVIAFGRQITLETAFRYTRLHNNFTPRGNDLIWSQSGSNGWAIGPQRTRDGSTILLANPHQPWFGFGQLCEVHLYAEQEGLNFIGAGLYGSPLPSLGHNDRLGWTLTTNEPDIADVWIEEFDNAEDPLAYRYGNGFRRAEEWTETIAVKIGDGFREEKHTFRKTHHGPIVDSRTPGVMLSANIAGLHNTNRLHQLVHMLRARNLDEFETALDFNEFPLMNVIYADVDGNIGYYYTGNVPQRVAGVDWSKPVEGKDPTRDWGKLHTAREFPRLVNPSIGYVQNCNSSPFLTTSAENPRPGDYPDYMLEDADEDRRRAMRSREILDASWNSTLRSVTGDAFDTRMYWATQQIPQLPKMFDEYQREFPARAKQLKPYVDHLQAWNGEVTADSTQATLCEAWYFEMHESEYPGEALLPKYVDQAGEQIQALGRAALRLKGTHGTWKVPWSDVFRIQRVPPVGDFWQLGFDDAEPSLPCLAVPGQLGAIFTQYYSPYVNFPIPWLPRLDRRYGVVGTSYLGIWEFGEFGVQGSSLVQFGASGDLNSPHSFDQAELLSQRKVKPELFSWETVVKSQQASYHPADRQSQAKSDAEIETAVIQGKSR